jgi:hypothetical protein
MAVWKITSDHLFTKQAMRKKRLKLLLNTVTVRTDTFVILENEFLYVCVKQGGAW